MKKLVLPLIAACATCAMCLSVSASEVEITKAEQSTQNGAVNVECSITTDYTSQAVTVYASEYVDGTYAKENPIYVNQYIPSISDGKFSFSFKPLAGIDTENTAYILRVGGYDVATPAECIIVFYDGKTYISGDVDGDGAVTSADAALVLKYIVGAGTLNGAQINAADVVKADDGVVNIDMKDVIEIMNSKTN